MILGIARRIALLDARKDLSPAFGGGFASFSVQRLSACHRRDGDPFLGDDISVVRPRRHVVQRDAGFLLAVDQHPVDRAAAPVLRQQRAVEVEASGRRDLQDGRGDHVAVVKGEDDVRLHLLDSLHPQGMVDVIGRKDRNALGCGKLRDGIKPEVFCGIILVGENAAISNPFPEGPRCRHNRCCDRPGQQLSCYSPFCCLDLALCRPLLEQNTGVVPSHRDRSVRCTHPAVPCR